MDLFTTHSIPQIQALAKQYSADVASAKADLHRLVGSKYRDLIKIAEDIDDMYAVSTAADQKLALLSYNPANFVLFNGSSTSRFNDHVRRQDLRAARANSKETILHNILHNKLTAAHPLVQTSLYIYHAKVFFTVERLFGDVLASNSVISARFSARKHQLNAYLEQELAAYNLFHHNDENFRINQRLVQQDLVSSHLIDGEYLYDEEYDYSQQNSAVVNYLLAYLILNPTVSFGDAIAKFVDLRQQHLDSLLSSIKDSVNFYAIFKFMENTCQFVEPKFLLSLAHEFRLATRPWKPSSLIGFRGWYEDDDIHFGPVSHEISTVSTDHLPLFLYDFLASSLQQPADTIATLSTDLATFHNFVLGFKLLQEQSSVSDAESKLIQLVVADRTLNKALTLVVSKIKQCYGMHFDKIGHKSGALAQAITASLQQDQAVSTQLFSPQLVDIMESDLDHYISLATASATTTTTTCNQLLEWLNTFAEFQDVTDIYKESTKLTKATCLSHVYLSIKKSKFGQFTASLVETEFKQLHNEVDALYWDKCSDFVAILEELLDHDNLDVKGQYYLLELLITLHKHLDNDAILVKITGIITKIYTTIVDELPKQHFNAAFELLQPHDADKPSLKLTSVLYQLCQLYGNSNLFMDPSVRSTFSGVKSKWIDGLVSGNNKALADTVFLLHFTGNVEEHSAIKTYTQQHPDVDVPAVIKTVREYFNTNRGVYLPLI